MSFINYSIKEINFKIVYYGPGLSGKTTNIKYLYRKVKNENKGKLVSLATEAKELYFLIFSLLILAGLKVIR